MTTSYIGLDLSWTGTGVYASNGGPDGAGVERVISTGKKAFLHRSERLNELVTQIMEVIHQYPISTTHIAIEGYSYMSSAGREMAGELGGAVRLELYRRGHNYVIVPPSTLKSYVTGAGNAKKELMLKEVLKKWGFDTDDNNVADAYALMRFCEEFHQPIRTAAFDGLVRRAKTLEVVRGAG